MTQTTDPPPAAAPKMRVRHDHGRPKYMYDASHRWSDEAEETFLDALAASCNVSHAAAACGFSGTSVYRRRRAHASFAARWDDALRHAYPRLEAAMLRAAIDTMEGKTFDDERPIPRMTVGEGLALLRMHAAAVGLNGKQYGRHPATRSFEDLREGLIRKVEAIRAAGCDTASQSSAGAKIGAGQE